jgi:hypothetical protein
VGCLIGKGVTSELAAWHDCSLGVIMKGEGAPAHHVTPGPRAGPWWVELKKKAWIRRQGNAQAAKTPCMWCAWWGVLEGCVWRVHPISLTHWSHCVSFGCPP